MNPFARMDRARLFLCFPLFVTACGSSEPSPNPMAQGGSSANGGSPSGTSNGGSAGAGASSTQGGAPASSGGMNAGSGGATAGGVAGAPGGASGGGGMSGSGGTIAETGGSAGASGGGTSGGTDGGNAGQAGGAAGASAGTAGEVGTAGADGGSGGSGGDSGTDQRDAHFQDWPQGADPKTVGDKVAQVFASENLDNSKHYKVACAWYGSLAISAILENQARLDNLIGKYAPYKNTWNELLSGQGHVDENVFGIVPLEIALHTNDASYAQEGLSIADHQRANIDSQKRFAIDDMFMITALQVQAYRVAAAQGKEGEEKNKYLDTAASTMVQYLDRLQQTDGLFHHHEDFHHKWARGNGWFAAGMAELIRELPQAHANYEAIRQGYEKTMSGLLTYQIKDGAGAGLWKQVVDSNDARNWPETSGSAMFTYALVSGVRAGWLEPETYGPAARAAWLALVGKIDAQGKLQDISDWAYKPESHPESGTKYVDDEENYYFDRPKLTGDNHGQAPILWIAAELARSR